MNEPYREPGKIHAPWEHVQIRVDADDLDKMLLVHGDNGWELVTACRIPANSDPVFYRLFFKRPK